MECLPVEVIGNILSHLGAAQDVVIASATCRKWREAFRKHLNTLFFNYNDLLIHCNSTINIFETIITKTIFQTTGLQCLLISMDDDGVMFSAASLIAWLLYTRESLRSLSYNVPTERNANIFEIYGWQKLEMLFLAHNTISGVDLSYQRFPCLKSLSLSNVNIAALDLSFLLTVCPKIEDLALINPEIAMLEGQDTMELRSPTLKSIHIEGISQDKFILEADSLESLHLKDSALDHFELIGKGTLKHLNIDDVNVIHLDIGDGMEHLEVVDVSNFTMVWPKFYQMISRSSKLRKLQLWGLVFDDQDGIVDLETIAVCFSQLRQLSLSFDLRDGLHYGLQGSSRLENVVVLELGWTVISEHFGHWAAGLLERCSNLKKLVIHGIISGPKSQEECQMLANVTSYIVRLMRKYMHVDVQFEYE